MQACLLTLNAIIIISCTAVLPASAAFALCSCQNSSTDQPKNPRSQILLPLKKSYNSIIGHINLCYCSYIRAQSQSILQ